MANTTIYPYGTTGQLPSDIGVINDLLTGGADKALSAEMGKTLRKAIARLLNALSPTAFTGEKPTDAELDIYAPKFTITLPTDTRVDMIDQSTQVEVGDSYTNTFSLNETAEEGYVLRLSATMEGGGTISADSTTGVVSTNNVTGDITIAASVGAAPSMVHKYVHDAEADDQSRTCLLDKTGNGFNLYTKNSLTNYNSEGYGNGRNRGLNGNTLLLPEVGSFTIHIKGLKHTAQYSTSQLNITCTDLSEYSAVTGYSSGSGQFNLGLRAESGAYQNPMPPCLRINGKSESVFFTDIKSSMNTATDYTLTYDDTTKTITMYKDGVASATTVTLTFSLVFRGILLTKVNSENLFDEIAFYNYAMTASEVSDLVNQSNSNSN